MGVEPDVQAVHFCQVSGDHTVGHDESSVVSCRQLSWIRYAVPRLLVTDTMFGWQQSERLSCTEWGADQLARAGIVRKGGSVPSIWSGSGRWNKRAALQRATKSSLWAHPNATRMIPNVDVARRGIALNLCGDARPGLLWSPLAVHGRMYGTASGVKPAGGSSENSAPFACLRLGWWILYIGSRGYCI